MTVEQKIQEIRVARGFSQEAVAHDLGISRNSYAKLERGETELTINRLEQIAKVLKVETWAFFYPDTAIVIMGDLENSGVVGHNGVIHPSDFSPEREAYQKHIETLQIQMQTLQTQIQTLQQSYEKQLDEKQNIIERFLEK